MTFAIRMGAALVLVAAAAGCERAILEGRVTDARGEALPGVVVRMNGTSRQDLTDGVGRYRLTAYRGVDSVQLQFSKSGYAPAELRVRMTKGLRIEAPEAALWRLPRNPGVYTLRDGKYESVNWLIPKEYYLKDGGTAYGMEVPETLRVEVTPDNWWLACFRTPRYNARLSRLAPAEATVPGVGAEPVPIWVESGTIAAGLEPVDTLDGNLLRIVVDRTLEPGEYAVHWGAIEGYTTLENRVYIFRVVEPPEPEPTEEDAEALAAEADDETSENVPDAIEPPMDEDTAPDEPQT